MKTCEKVNEYKFEFRKRCYKEYPPGSKKPENISINKYYYEAICPEDKPFELLSTQEWKIVKSKSLIWLIMTINICW